MWTLVAMTTIIHSWRSRNPKTTSIAFIPRDISLSKSNLVKSKGIQKHRGNCSITACGILSVMRGGRNLARMSALVTLRQHDLDFLRLILKSRSPDRCRTLTKDLLSTHASQSHASYGRNNRAFLTYIMVNIVAIIK